MSNFFATAGTMLPALYAGDGRHSPRFISIGRKFQVFCNVCWNEHLTELESNLTTLVKQVDESKVRLDHKLENFESRCRQLLENIKEATLQKIELIKMDEEKVLKDVQVIMEEGKVAHHNIDDKLQELKDKLTSKSFEKSPGKVRWFC
jgi:tripartite motif-containing protein 2/3